VQRTVDELGDGWRLPFPGVEGLEHDASLRGLDESDRVLLAARAVAHPWGTYTQPLCLERQGPPAYRQVVIACDDVRGMVAACVPQIVPLTREPWQYLELDLASRGAALVALGQQLFLALVYFSSNRWLFEQPHEYVPLIVLAIVPAGRAWGLDAWLLRRYPSLRHWPF
jgi:hypothetical protein